jgi:hypothetical protein
LSPLRGRDIVYGYETTKFSWSVLLNFGITATGLVLADSFASSLLFILRRTKDVDSQITMTFLDKKTF